MHQQTDQARASCLASSDLSYLICSLCTSDTMAAADHGEGHRDCRRRSERRAKDKDSGSAEMMIESEDSSDTSSDVCVATGSQSDTSDYTDAGSLSRTLSLENLGKDKAVAKRKSRTLTFRRKKSDKVKDTSKKRGRFWTFRLKKHFPVRLKKPKEHGLPEATANVEQTSCVCTGYRRTEDHVLGPGVVFSARASISSNAGASPIQAGAIRQHRLSMGAGPGPSGLSNWNAIIPAPPPAAASTSNTLEIDLNRLDDAYPCEDIDELRIAQRARDMEQGIDLTGGNSSSSSHGTYPHLRYSHSTSSSSTSSSSGSSATSDHIWNLSSGFQNQCMVATTTTYPPADSASSTASSFTGGERTLYSLEYGAMATPTAYVPRTVHTQIDYVHCLVPDLLSITKCGFYWGVMDRYEAEKLLENRPEGTFLLRDSAQEEFLFSVSFRRYGRSLHARLEQWNHKFSFDSHDPGVFASNTVCGLIEHYKDPSCCMFFEPMLTISLNRSFPFSLQHLCRAVIASSTTYDGTSFLPLPKTLKEYLQYYHYKQKVRVRRFEVQTRS